MANCKVYKRFFQEAPIGLYRTRCSDGLFLDINPFGATLLGFSSQAEVVNKVCSTELYAVEEREKLLAVLREKREVTDYEVKMTRKDGTIAWVSLTARNGGDEIIGSFADITEKKELEVELEQYRTQALAPIVSVCELAKQRIELLDNSALVR